MHARAMIETYPKPGGAPKDAIVAVIEATLDCAQVCIACADACLGEDEIDKMRQCIRLDLDCADICFATASLASRRTGDNRPIFLKQLEACIAACAACAEECEAHAGRHEHCRICAEVCRACERACREVLGG